MQTIESWFNVLSPFYQTVTVSIVTLLCASLANFVKRIFTARIRAYTKKNNDVFSQSLLVMAHGYPGISALFGYHLFSTLSTLIKSISIISSAILLFLSVKYGSSGMLVFAITVIILLAFNCAIIELKAKLFWDIIDGLHSSIEQDSIKKNS